MKINLRTAHCVAASFALTTWSAGVIAQEVAAENEDGVLGQVIVTAERRSENLQDVPVAVTVLDAAALEMQSVGDVTSLAAAVPALTVTRVNNAATPFLRGIGTGVVTPGEDPSVALYLDGVYLTAPQAQLFSFNSIERIEVLKGPQGTLFGRNATGGVIQIITKDPSHTPSAEMRLGYGNYATSEGAFYGTTPVTDDLATDLALTGSHQDEGWGHGDVTGEETFRLQEYGIRNKWFWTPSDDTSIRLSADYSRSRGQSGLPNNFVPGAFGFDGVTTSTGFYNASGNPPGGVDTQQGGLALPIQHDLGWAQFVSITSWRKLLSNYFYDQDGTPIRRLKLDVENRAQTVTQELQLQSEKGRLQWIAGLYALRDVASQQNRSEGLLTGAAAYTGSLGEQTTESYSAFGQMTLAMFADTDLTLGTRYTTDTRAVEGWTEVGPTAIVTSPVRTLVPERDRTFSKLTWRLSLDHRFSPDVLGYVSYNRGFKAGLWNTSNPTANSVDPELIDAYEVGAKTELFDHRVRLNTALFWYEFQDIHVDYIFAGNNNILNAARAQIKGVDVDVQAALGKHVTLQGGASYSDGNYSSFVGAPSYVLLPAGAAALTFIDASDNETVRTPKVTANVGATYSIVTAGGGWDISGNVSYNSDFYWQFDNNLREPSHTQVGTTIAWTDPSERWSVNVWGRNLLNEEIRSYARIGGTGAQYSPAPPRTYGVTFIARFD